MPDPIMIAVEVGGETHQVPLPDGYLSSEAVAADFMKKDLFETEVGRRATSIADTKVADAMKPETLMKDESFVDRFIKSLGLVKPTEVDPNKPPVVHTPTAEQIASLQEDWRKAELAPISTQLTESQASFQRLTTRTLESDIVQAAALAGVKERFLKPAAAGQAPPIVAMMGQVFRYSPEHERHFVAKGDDHFEITSDPKSDLPFKTASEFITVWAGLPENKDFVDTASRRGPGLDTPSGVASGQDVILTREEAGDHATYSNAQDKAEKQGGVVRVSGTPTFGATASAGGV